MLDKLPKAQEKCPTQCCVFLDKADRTREVRRSGVSVTDLTRENFFIMYLIKTRRENNFKKSFGSLLFSLVITGVLSKAFQPRTIYVKHV